MKFRPGFLKPTIKSLSGKRRNWAKANKFYLTGRNRINADLTVREIKRLEVEISWTIPLVRAHKVGFSVLRRLRKLRHLLYVALLDAITLPFDVRTADIGKEKRGVPATIDGWDDLRIPEDFRVDNKEELRALFQGFQFPVVFRFPKSRRKFTGEKVFLFGMYRLANVTKLSNDVVPIRFGFHDPAIASECFRSFITFMVNSWGYLLTNNFAYWVDQLPNFAQSIRLKAQELGVWFPEGFNVCAFTDNTMNAACRPSGGPQRDGNHAPRNDPLIQRGWYNGWKKLHGLKFQTIDLPNSMNAHIWGPCSVRHNDLWTLGHSNLNDVVAGPQASMPIQYVI